MKLCTLPPRLPYYMTGSLDSISLFKASFLIYYGHKIGGIKVRNRWSWDSVYFQGFVRPRNSCKIRSVTQQCENLSLGLRSLGLTFYPLTIPPASISYIFSNEEKGNLVLQRLVISGQAWLPRNPGTKNPCLPFSFSSVHLPGNIKNPGFSRPYSGELPISLEGPLPSNSIYRFDVRW